MWRERVEGMMETAKEGLFLTLEGIDGFGKSTQAGRLASWLRERGPRRPVLWTREPGGWPGGADFRERILRGQWEHPWSEVFLFLADRCEHVLREILPALARGEQVLCERYHDSTLAYQSFGRGLPLEALRRFSRDCRFPLPHRTLLLDLPVEDALRRLQQREGAADRLEGEGRPFLERVRRGFLCLAEAEPERYAVVDARGDEEQVFARLCRAVEERTLP